MDKEHIDTYRSLFIHQEGRFAAQTARGSYVLRPRPVSDELVQQHLAGDFTAGWYAFRDDGTITWACVDSDEDDGLRDLSRLWDHFRQYDVPSYLEQSRRGGHLWVFTEPIAALPVRRMVVALVEQANIGPVEVFPKQDELRPKRIGSAMRGPLGVHRKDGHTYDFVEPRSLEAIGLAQVDQLDYLTSFERVSAAQVADALAKLWDASRRPQTTDAEGRKATGVIAQLKEALDICTLVAEYVEVDARGRAHCPWHGPDRRPSLLINEEDGYFVDFHDGTGGDAIEFYRRIEHLTPRVAIGRLAKRYL